MLAFSILFHWICVIYLFLFYSFFLHRIPPPKLTCPYDPLTPSSVSSAWMICLIEVCGWQVIHLINLVKPRTIYLPVVVKVSLHSCWECREKQESYNDVGFSIKVEGSCTREGSGTKISVSGTVLVTLVKSLRNPHIAHLGQSDAGPSHGRDAAGCSTRQKARKGQTIEEQGVLITLVKGS